MTRFFALAIAAAIIAIATPSRACTEDESWWDVTGSEGAPANEVLFVLGYPPGDLVAKINGQSAAFVPVDFGVKRREIYLDPMPRDGDTVTFCGDGDCDDQSFTVGPDDVMPPSLASFFFDVHDHPLVFGSSDSCSGGEGTYDVTYHLHLEGLEHDERDHLFIELRAPSDDRLLHRRSQPLEESLVTLELRESYFDGIAPEDVCVSVVLSDRAGNALTPVTSCAPCRLSRTETGQDPSWTEESLFPGGVCATESPTPERLPRLPALPRRTEPSGCSFSPGVPVSGWGPWLILGLIGLRRRKCAEQACLAAHR